MAIPYVVDDIDMLICPACKSSLEILNDKIICLNCSHRYGIEDGIPLLFCPNEWGKQKEDVTDIVKSFYEKTPFPDYEDLETVSDVCLKAEKSLFASLLNKQIPLNARVLEVGCGTGQLCNFLGIADRAVYGTDICINSLKLAQNFKNKNNIERVKFYQMNLFRPIFKEQSFSFVICNGALHHTSDPFLGFQTIARLVKKGGYILIGLYNKYARIPIDILRLFFRMSRFRLTFLDPRLKENKLGSRKKEAWVADQYKNPHESKHAIKEILKWFDQTDFDFINSIPKLKFFSDFSENELLFEVNPKGNCLDHFLLQFSSIFNVTPDNGLFLFIGRRK